MERRSFLKGLFAAAAVAAGCAARPPGAEAAPLPARPTPPVEPKVAGPAVADDADVAAAKVEKAQYYVVRRRWRPRRRVYRRVYYVRPRRVYYYRPRRVYYRRRYFW
jgi:hypothetical protein